MGLIGRASRQFGVAKGALRAVVASPKLFVYPILTMVLGVGVPAGLAGLTHVVGLGAHVGLFASFVVFPIVFAFLMTSYCYEVNEVFEGRTPSLGEGMGVAAGRLKLVVVAALVVGVGGFAVRSLGDTVPFGNLIGIASAWGLKVAGVFAFPVIATTDGSVKEAFGDVVDAVKDEWGKSLVATAGTQLVGMAIAGAGFVGAVALAAAALTGTFGVDVGPLRELTLPVVVLALGIVTAIIVQFTISGLLKVALFRYANEGELPSTLSMDADAIVDVDG